MSKQNQFYHDNDNNNNNHTNIASNSQCGVQRQKSCDSPILFHDRNRPKSQQHDKQLKTLQIKDACRINRNDQIDQNQSIIQSIEQEINELFLQNGSHSIKNNQDPALKVQLPTSLLNQFKIIRNQQNIKNKCELKFKKLYFQESDEFPLKSRLYSIANQSQKSERGSSISKKNEFQLLYDLNSISTQKKQCNTASSLREKNIQRNISPILKMNSFVMNQKDNTHDLNNIQNLSCKFDSNYNNIDKSDHFKLKCNKQITFNRSISQLNSFEDEEQQQTNINDYQNQYHLNYDPDKDINFDKYSKKQIQVLKGLQQRHIRNPSNNNGSISINSQRRESEKQNSDKQNQFYSNNNSFITLQNTQRGQSASQQSRKSLYNYSVSPKKSKQDNIRYFVMKNNQLNKTACIQQQQQKPQLKQFGNTNDFNKLNKNKKDQMHFMYGKSDQIKQNSPFQQDNQIRNNQIQHISNTFNIRNNINSMGQEIKILQQNNSEKKSINQQKVEYQNLFNVVNNQAINSQQQSSLNNQISNSQQPSKTHSYRQGQNKKIVKEEELDKEVIRKIIDRVEKLLCEKEEKLPSEIESKTNERQSYEKQEELNLPEQNFNHHLKQITEMVKSKSQQDSAQASFLKGVGRMKKNKDRSAITAFKQALNFDKAHFLTIYNLACIYERNKRFKCAETWLEIANMFKKNKNEINYGFAIIYYKSFRFEESHKKIDSLIDELSKNLEEEESIPQTHLYLRSLCAKKLGQQSLDKDNKVEEKQYKSTIIFDDKTKSQSMKLSKKKGHYSKQLSQISNYEDEGRQQKKEQQLLLTPSSQQYFQKSSDDYKTFIKYTCPKNFMLLKHFMFAVVFKKIRKMEIKFPPHILCEFFSLVKQILASETYEPALEPIIQNEETAIQNGYAPPILIGKIHSGLEIDKKTNQHPPLIQPGVGLKLSLFERRKEEIAKKISDLSFFKRFPTQTIQYFLPNFELRYIEKSELLFAQKGEVFIITGGHLTVFDHSKQFNEPDIVAYYSEGDIIGCDDKDNKISFHPDIWFLSLTRVEYVVIPESDFLDLWNLQNDPKNRQILNFIRQIDIFDKVSQLTLYRLAFELFKEKIFQNNDIVFNDAESVNKYHYIELHKEDPKTLKNLRNRINNKIDIISLTQQAIYGFYIIQEGTLELNSFSNWQNYVLRPYNYIGENLLFPTLSISRFGQIICSSYQSKCLFLSRYDFHKISSLDKEVMKSNVVKSDYYANCQRILHKYYKHHKIEDFDQETINNNN